MEERPFVKCENCFLVQFVTPDKLAPCRRCARILPAYKPPPTPAAPPVEEPVQIIWGDTLPMFGNHIDGLLVQEAMRRTKTREEAAALIGCSRNTVARYLRRNRVERGRCNEKSSQND